MPSKTESKTATTKKANKTPTQYVYAYVFNGGVLKQNHCIVGVSIEHPETTVFNELKKYYGNDIKGAFYRCSKTLDDVKAGITFKLSKFYLTDILYNNNFSETKKVLLEVTGLDRCSGTINVFHKKEDEEELVQKDVKPETNDSESELESEDEKLNEKPVAKSAKGSKGKNTETVKETKEQVKESKSKGKEVKVTETIKKSTKSSKKIVDESESESESEEENESEPEDKKKSVKKSDKKETKSKGKEVAKEVVKETKQSKSKTTKKVVVESEDNEVQPKKNNTSIELSDESDEENTN
jgi:hypothetical protein